MDILMAIAGNDSLFRESRFKKLTLLVLTWDSLIFMSLRAKRSNPTSILRDCHVACGSSQ